MAGSPLIVALAVGMLIYWFRYACSVLLRSKIEPDCVARVAAANGLSLLPVRAKLRLGEGQLDSLRKSLDRDYRLLRYLLRHGRGGRIDFLAARLLLCHHFVMQVWYWCVRVGGGDRARKALEERARILTWLAHEVGRTVAADVTPVRHDTIMTWHPKRRSSQQSIDSIKFAVKSQRSS